MKEKFIAERYRTKGLLLSGGAQEALKMPDLINLSLGDPDITTPRDIIQQAFEDALAGHTHYTPTQGDPELIDGICQAQKEEYGLDLKKEEVFITASACHGMWLVLETMLEEGDEVLIPDPYFTPYQGQVTMAGGTPVFVPTYSEEGFALDIHRIEERITPKTKALIINSPNNPTGAVLSRENLLALGRLAKERDFLLIADDIYTEFSYEEDFVPISSLEDFFEHTITLRSFSKNYAMTGWRLGYVLAGENFIEAMGRVNESNVYVASSISQRAALYGITHRKKIQEPLKEIYRRRCFFAYEKLKELKNLSLPRPRGTFYLFPDIRKTGYTSQEVADALLQEAHILVIPGHVFGEMGEGFIRIAVTVGEETFAEAVERIKRMEMFRL